MQTNTLSPEHQEFLNQIPEPPKEADTVEGTIVAMGRGRIFVDLPPFGTGIIYGREYLNAADILRKANVGDTISAKVVETSGKDGYIELSLKEARQAAMWSEADQAIASGAVFSLTVEDANKGGLILSWNGIQGFLPASQLSTKNYPRVPDANKDKILDELRKLSGKQLEVKIITADAREGKLIFSEKTQEGEETRIATSEKYSVGDVVLGSVTGAVDFGIFVELEPGLEGLVHISEIDWALVEDPRTVYKVSEKVSVKVIEIKEGKVSLSIKALKENPWHAAAEKYKVGQKVDGVIIKYNKYGALASIEEGVAGLVHVSEFETTQALRDALELGKVYTFTVALFDAKEQRMTLSFKGEVK